MGIVQGVVYCEQIFYNVDDFTGWLDEATF